MTVLSKLEAGRKRTWKMHQTFDDLQKWSAYLQQSSERFEEEMQKYSSSFVLPMEQKLMKEIKGAFTLMKKESALLKSRVHRLRGQT
jgi:hypothetical protein